MACRSLKTLAGDSTNSMKQFAVSIRIQTTRYPMEFKYRINAGNEGRAAFIAYRMAKKEPAMKGRRIRGITTAVSPSLGKVITNKDVIGAGHEAETANEVGIEKPRTRIPVSHSKVFQQLWEAAHT